MRTLAVVLMRVPSDTLRLAGARCRRLPFAGGSCTLPLYDLKNDPDDRTDLAEQNPEKVQELSASMKDWLKATPIVFHQAEDQKQ